MPWKIEVIVYQFTCSSQRLTARQLNDRWMMIQRLDHRHAVVRRGLFEMPTAIAPETCMLQMLKNQRAGIGKFLT